MGEKEIRAEYQKRLKDIYKRKNRSKVKAIPKLLDKHKNNLHDLYLKICSKYDIKPKSKFPPQKKKKKEEVVILEPIELAEAASMLPVGEGENDRQRRAIWWRWALDHDLCVGGMIGQEQAVEILKGQFGRPCDFDLNYAVAYSCDLALSRSDSLAISFRDVRGFLVALKLYLTVVSALPDHKVGSDPGIDFMRFSAIVPIVEDLGYKFRGSKDEWFLTIIHSEPGLIAKKIPMSLFLQWSTTKIFQVMKQALSERSEVSKILEACDILPIGRSMAEGRLRQDIFKMADRQMRGKITLEESRSAIAAFCEHGYILKRWGKRDNLSGLKKPIDCAFEVCTYLHDEDEIHDPDHINFLNFRMFLLSITRFLTLWEFFEQIDTSNDQIIQYDEFQQALPMILNWGIDVGDPMITFAQLDANNMEGIHFNEFAAWALREGSFQNAPRDIDDLEEEEDYDGVTSAAYRRLLSKSIFSKFSNDRNQLFRRIDKNGDRKLSPEEFRAGIQRVGITLTDDELEDVFWVFDDMSQNFITQKKFTNIVPRGCDERMLLLICNDILEGRYKSRNKPWPEREATLEDFDPEIRAMKRKERLKEKAKYSKKGKKGKKNKAGGRRKSKLQSKKNSKRGSQIEEKTEQPFKKAEEAPLPNTRQSGKLDATRGTKSLQTSSKILDSNHEIKDYETSTIASEPRSGILEEEKETVHRKQHRPHNDEDYAKHLERRNKEILRRKSANKDFHLSGFRFDQVVDSESSKSGTANSGVKDPIQPLHVEEQESENEEEEDDEVDADQIVENIVNQHPQLKGKQDHINAILQVVSDVLIQQMGSSAAGSIEDQVNERLAGTLFQGLDASTNSSELGLKKDAESTSFQNLYADMPDTYSPKTGPSALNPELVDQLNEEFSLSKSEPLKGATKSNQLTDINQGLMDDLTQQFGPKAVRFGAKEDDMQSILSEDIHHLKELGIMPPGEVLSEQDKEAEREKKQKKMHRLRAESKRATDLEKEILEFCRFLSSDLAQTEFQPLSADTLDNPDMSIINSENSSSNFSPMPTFTSMMSDAGWQESMNDEEKDNIEGVSLSRDDVHKRGPSQYDADAAHEIQKRAPDRSDIDYDVTFESSSSSGSVSDNDSSAWKRTIDTPDDGPSKDELARITELNQKMQYRESMDLQPILKHEEKKLSASQPMDSIEIAPQATLQMSKGGDREKSLMQRRKYKQDALKRSSEAFHKVRKDENGFIELPAFHEAIRHLNLQITPAQAEALFVALDQLKLGCLSSEEFKNGVLEGVMSNIAREATENIRHGRKMSSASFRSFQPKKRRRKKNTKTAAEDFPECLEKFVGERRFKHKNGVSTALAFVRDLKSTTGAIDRHVDDGTYYGVVACGIDDDLYRDEQKKMMSYILELARKFLERKDGFLYSIQQDVFVTTTRFKEEEEFKLFTSQLNSWIIQRIFHEYPGVEIKYSHGVYKRSQGYKPFTTQIIKKIRPEWCQADMKSGEMLDLAKKLPLRASAEEREKRMEMWRLNKDSDLGGHMNIEEASNMLTRFYGKKTSFNLDNAVRFAFHHAYSGADDDEYIIIYSEFRKFLTYLQLYLFFRSVTGDEEDDPGLGLEKYKAVMDHMASFGVRSDRNLEEKFAEMAEGGDEIPMSLLLVDAVKEINAVTDRITRLIKGINIDADLAKLADLLPVERTSEETKIRETIFARADQKKRGYAKLDRLRRSVEKFLGKDVSDLDLAMKYAFYVQRSISRSKGIPSGEPLRLFLVNVQRYVQMKVKLELKHEDEATLTLQDFQALVPVFAKWGLKLSSLRKTFDKISEKQNRVSFPVVAMWALTKGQEAERKKDSPGGSVAKKIMSQNKIPKYGSQLSVAHKVARSQTLRGGSDRWRSKPEPQIRRHTYDIADDMSDVSSLGRVEPPYRRRDSAASIKLKRRGSIDSDISTASRRPDHKNLSKKRVKRRRDSNDSTMSGFERVRRKMADDDSVSISGSESRWQATKTGEERLSERWQSKGRTDNLPRMKRQNSAERAFLRLLSSSSPGRLMRSDEIRSEIKLVLAKPVAKPMVEFLGDRADEVLSPSFVLNVKQKLKDGLENIQGIVVSRLRDMCVEVESQNNELGMLPKSRTLTAGSDEFSRDGIDEDDAQLEEAASEKIQVAFDNVKKDETGFMELNSFYSAVTKLNLNFSKTVCDTLFKEIDSLGVGCLSLDEFKKGVLKHVINSFNYAVGPRGSELLEQNDVSSRVVETLKAHHPLNILTFDNGFGQTVGGYWVRKSDVIRRIQPNFRSKYRSDHKESIEIQRARTLTPMTKDYSIPRVNRMSLGGSPREQVVRTNSGRRWDRANPRGETEDVPKSFGKLGRRNSKRDYKLPKILDMIRDGKSKTAAVDTGNQNQLLCIIVLSVNEHVFFEEVCEQVAELANRFCHLNGGTLYHIDDDLFSILINVNEKHDSKDFKRKICQYIIKRSSHTGVGIKTSSTVYEQGERFGKFCDRAIHALRPTWLINDAKSRLNELLYNIVADKKNFSKYSLEVIPSNKNWKWDENSVISCIKKLISRGASFRYVDSEGNDAVMFAAKNGYSLILNQMLSHPRSINTKRQNRDGMSLLMVAIYYRRLDSSILNKLLSLEHDFKIQDRKGRTVLIHSMNVDNSMIKNRLIESGAEDIQPEIVDACKYDKLDVIRRYHNSNLSLTARVDDYGSTVACQAASNGSSKILRFCMERTSDLGHDFAAATPLHYACHYQHANLIQMLLDFGANVNAQDSHGESPLLCAATTGSIEVCRKLIRAGANVDLVDKKGTSPLMRAAVYGHTEICDLLIEHHCNVAAIDSDYNNAANMAEQQEHHALANKLNYLIFEREQHFE